MPTGCEPIAFPREKLQALFESLEDWAVLRDPDVWAVFARGGDCDIFVADRPKACARIVEILGPPMRIAIRSYVSSFYYEWGHIDVADAIDWRGLKLMSAKDVLVHAADLGNGIRGLAPSLRFSIALANALLWKGEIKQRYLDGLKECFEREPQELEMHLENLFGDASVLIRDLLRRGDIASVGTVAAELRSRVASARYGRNPLRSVQGKASFLAGEVKIRLWPQSVCIIRLAEDGPAESGSLLAAVKEWCGARELQVSAGSVARREGSAPGSSGLLATWLSICTITFRRCAFRARNGVLLLDVPAGSLPVRSLASLLGRTPFFGPFLIVSATGVVEGNPNGLHLLCHLKRFLDDRPVTTQ